MLEEDITGLAEGSTYQYRICGYRTAPEPAGSESDPACFDADRGDPPNNYDFVTTLRSPPPPGFTETTVLSDLENPTAVRFTPGGQILVAEKAGRIKLFDGLGDSSPELLADLRIETHNHWDRGLAAIELDPGYPAEPYLYVLYSRDAEIGGTAPRWGTGDPTFDECPDSTTDGCLASGRLIRLELSANGDAVVDTTTLVDGWCQHFPFHSVDSIAFDSSGALYASAGEAANFLYADYGQAGDPPNPCGDPPSGVGGTQSPPLAEGGALRSQDVRTLADPTGLDGTVIRVDPATGAALPDNPLFGSSDPEARKIVAYGLRNPFRMAFRPGTDELWIGDVGWNANEEIDRLPPGPALNFGWPCYEGAVRQAGYDGADLALCESLYATPSDATAPYYEYSHSAKVTPGDGCPDGTSSITGLAFADGSSFPPTYDGGLFFGDFARNCIWAMRDTNGDGVPDPAAVERFLPGAPTPVDLQFGPDGHLYYVDILGGKIQQISYNGPTAVAEANPEDGEAPLTVELDASGSSDPNDPPSSLAFAWDLDGDGQYDDSSAKTFTHTYTQAGTYTARLRVTDPGGVEGFDSVEINASNGPPVPVISSPLPSRTWAVGEQITFSGSATDPEDGPLPASALRWDLVLDHCPDGCHEHQVVSFEDVASGDFAAPDHDYPSNLRLTLTAADSSNVEASTSVSLNPKTVQLTLKSSPTGLLLSLNSATRQAPFTTTLIQGSTNTISAPSPQTLGGKTYRWIKWSDNGAQTHTITVNATKALTATYKR